MISCTNGVERFSMSFSNSFSLVNRMHNKRAETGVYVDSSFSIYMISLILI